jgi:predicted permease
MHDLKFAFRQLLKNPGFTAVAAISLAVGIGLNTAVFSIINCIFFQTIRGVPNPREIVFFNDHVTFDAYNALQDQLHTLEGVVAGTGFQAELRAKSFEGNERIAAVSDNYFSILRISPALGRLLRPTHSGALNNSPEAVLSYTFWKARLNGDPGVIGSSINLNGVSFDVVGVCPENFHGPGPEGPQVWIPVGAETLATHASIQEQQNRSFGLLGRLRAGASLKQVQAEADLVALRNPDLFAKRQFYLSLGKEEWRGKPSAEKRAEFLLVTAVPLVVAGIVLCIACSNVSNLLLARGVSRKREFAVRLAIGASTWQVLRLVLTESLLLAIFGGALGLLLARWTIEFIFATFASFSNFSVQMDGRVLLYSAAVALGAALIAGLLPAWQSSREDVNGALKQSMTASNHRSRLRSFFLITQLASALALLSVAGIFVKTLLATYAGPQARLLDELVLVRVPLDKMAAPERPEFIQKTMAALNALPAVKTAARFEPDQSISINTDPARTNSWEVTWQRVGTNFFFLTQANLLRGHYFSERLETPREREVVINEAAAERYWKGSNPVGNYFTRTNGEPYQIVGMVRDGADGARVYSFLPLTTPDRLDLLVRTRGKAITGLTQITQCLRGLDSRVPFPMVATYRAAAFSSLDQISRVAAYVAFLALGLAMAGLYGSVSFMTGQRTREIGIRMALGSNKAQVIRMVLASVFKLVATGAVVGLLLAMTGLRLLSGLLFGKWPFDPVAMLGVLFCFAVVSLLACWFPARRAAGIDPMLALRHE